MGANPTVLAVNGSHTYVLNSGNRTISVIDNVSKQVVKTIPVNATGWNMVVSPDDRRIYVANYDTVSVFDTATGNEVVAPSPSPTCARTVCYGSAAG